MSDDTGSISDGYHTFDELYEHRHALFIALAQSVRPLAWRSRTHDDGFGYPGWFIAGIDTPVGQISYHLPDRLWPLLDPIEERLPNWDGHNSGDVVDRLKGWVS